MNNYEKKFAAFKKVSAYSLSYKDETASVAIKYPLDGMGRVKVYLHVRNLDLVIGSASGCGYDKTSAAFKDACRELETLLHESTPSESIAFARLIIASIGDHNDWSASLRKAGVTVITVI